MSIRTLPPTVLTLACLTSFNAWSLDLYYQGQVVLKKITGKDCGSLKVGDSLPFELLVSQGIDGYAGYSRIEGSDPGRLSGKQVARLTVTYPDPDSSDGNFLLLGPIGGKAITGMLRERALKDDESGCDLTQGAIRVKLVVKGNAATSRLQVLSGDFQSAQLEYAARQRDPEAYAEIQRLLPQANQAAKTEGGASQALTLFDELAPLTERAYGKESLNVLLNIAARAQMHGMLGEHEQAEQLRREQLQLAVMHYPDRVASTAYNLGDVLETRGQLQEALAAYEQAAKADETTYGASHPEVASDLKRVADVQAKLQDYKQEAAARQRILSILGTSGDSKSIEQARSDFLRSDARARDPIAYSRLVELEDEVGKAKNGGDLAAAVAARQEMILLAEKSYGTFSRYRADLLYQQASDLDDLSRGEEALALYPEALAAMEAAYGKEHENTARVLYNYAWQSKKQGKYDEALTLYQRALGIAEQALGADHELVAGILNNMALLYQWQGRYDQAVAAYQRALVAMDKRYGSGHADTITVRLNLATLYADLGRFDESISIQQSILSLRERTLGPEHELTATSLSILGSSYQMLLQYESALSMFSRALTILEKRFGQNSPELSTVLNNLADLYVELGQYEKAAPLYQRMLSIDESSLGSDHPKMAIGLSSVATFYLHLAKYDQALSLAKRSLEIRERALGPNHIDVANSLLVLAEVNAKLSRHEEAMRLAKRAVQIKEKLLGVDSPAVAYGLISLAALHDDAEEYEQAIQLYQRGLNIQEKTFGKEYPGNAFTLNNMAHTYRRMGLFERALPLHLRALALHEKALGDAHVDTASSYSSLALTEGSAGKLEDSLGHFHWGNELIGKTIDRVFAIASEKDKLAYVQQQEWGYFGELSLIHRHFQNDQAALRQGLDLVLARKGIVFDAQARQNEALAASLDPTARKLWDELARQRALQSRLLQSKPEKLTQEEYRQQIKVQDDKVGMLERQLADKSTLVAEQLRQRNVTSEALAKRLPKGSVLAEFVKIKDYDWDKGRWSDTQRYLGFVLQPGGQITLADLGEANALEAAIQSQLKQLDRIGFDSELQMAAARELQQILWQPLSSAAGRADTVVFSPDGLLNLVPFAAMLDEQGHFFIEDHNVIYVTSGRELVKENTAKPDGRLFLAANPAFDLNARPVESVAETSSATRSAGFNLQFGALPGTQEEADYIPGMLRGKQRVVTGQEATEAAVLGAGHPQVLHLATHGFFLSDQPLGEAGTRGAMALQESGSMKAAIPQLPPGYENPLVRSGLALAGANHAGQVQSGSDGLLTALEVSGMNLHGTDLVTLSACETGRGEVKSGEGVFGLRRAFSLSGAKHLVMSLWPVSDEVTAQQMRTLYREYGAGKRPSEALRTAQLNTLTEYRKQGKATPPALWAPFIVQGW